MSLPRFLFICSRNQWRSRTAETVFRKDRRVEVKSAGTSPSARIRVREDLVRWADLVFVMEEHHADKLMSRFGREKVREKLVVLDIPDAYPYMDADLVEELKDCVESYL